MPKRPTKSEAVAEPEEATIMQMHSLPFDINKMPFEVVLILAGVEGGTIKPYQRGISWDLRTCLQKMTTIAAYSNRKTYD